MFNEKDLLKEDYTKEEITLMKKVCPKCASKDIVANYYVGISGEAKHLGEPLKESLNSEVVEENDSAYPYVKIYCNECGYEISREVDMGIFETSEIAQELAERAKYVGSEEEFISKLNELLSKLQKDEDSKESEAVIHDVEYDLAHGGIKWEKLTKQGWIDSLPRDDDGNIQLK